jgi:hypothetical protein
VVGLIIFCFLCPADRRLSLSLSLDPVPLAPRASVIDDHRPGLSHQSGEEEKDRSCRFEMIRDEEEKRGYSMLYREGKYPFRFFDKFIHNQEQYIR